MPKAAVNGVHLDFEMRGEGAPLMMICGFRRNRVIWGEALLAPLAERFRLILFDNRGTGHSDQPEVGYSMEAFADDAAGLLEHVGVPRAHVFGVSMGGMIAQTLAVRHPQQVWGLGLGCTYGGGESVVPADREVTNLLRLIPGNGLSPREVAERQEAAYYTDTFRERHRDVIDAVYEQVQQAPPPPHAVKGHLAAIEAFDGHARLGDIAASTLVITGDADRLIVPENSHLLAQRIPQARLVVLKDAAHFFWIEKPAETAEALIEFFGGLD